MEVFTMKNQEIMENVEVIELEPEELVSASSGSGLKLVGGALILVGLAYGGYKLIRKWKAKKEQEAIPESLEAECVETIDDVE